MYRFNDLVDIYRQIDPGPSRIITLKTDLMALGRFEPNGGRAGKQAILDEHLAALDKAFNLDRTTLVVATSTTNLCGTDIPYDPDSSRSVVGAFTEHVRLQHGAQRSFHAFESYSALGADTASICSNVSPVSYGYGSPESRLVEGEATCIVVGANPLRCCSTIHYLEQAVGVPYRYVRTYQHPVIRDGVSKIHTFYRNPWYRNSDINKNTDRFFQHLDRQGFCFQNFDIGIGSISAYSVAEVFKKGAVALSEDPFLCLSHTPKVQPWYHADSEALTHQ